MASKRPPAASNTKAKDKRPAAFISAPLTVDTSFLEHALESRGLEVIRPDKLETGLNISDLLWKWMDRADYVIGVMGETANPNVVYEVGMASGMGKPVLLLASHHGAIPAAAAGLTYLKAAPDNRDAIEFGLDQLLSAPRTRAVPQPSVARETHPIGAAADRLLRTIATSRDGGAIPETQLIELICTAMKESGVSAISRESSGEGRRIADIAVWSGDFEPWIGNPLIIEVKKSLNGRSELESAIERLSANLNETRSHGLLLYLASKPIVLYGGSYDPRVMVMSVEDLIHGLRDEGLGDLLGRARNDMVHVRG